ncbi:MAG TPA: tetratricopeptide repeat protein [Candidatus Sulfotelmatobacter sp.]|jgi:tetratricopeptide (TPR) repeat protein|nr:tetratricopeptide repeat protein [Candidatus Sulfotelmatobacter sp.]
MFHERQWSEAAAAFEQCEVANPGKTDALLYRGKSLVNLRKFAEAATDLQTFALSHPQSDDAAYLLAYVSFRQEKPRESLDLFSKAAKLKPPAANDLMIIALDYVLLNDYTQAANYLESSLKINPDDVEARYHLGRVRYQQNQFDAAITAFQDVINRDPRNMKAYDNLGLSLEAKNQVEGAMAAYRKAIELDEASSSHSEQPYLNLGSLLTKSNMLPNGISLLTRASEIAPREFKVHYELAKAYFDSRELDRARQHAEQAVQLNSADSSSHYLLGRIYQRLNRKDQAAEQFRLTAALIHEKNTSHGGMASGQIHR